jgi:hypothetical protein
MSAHLSALTAATIRVLDVPERFRFEIRVDGELAGFSEYRRRPGLHAAEPAGSSPINAPPASPQARPVAAPARGQPDAAADRSR